MWKTASGSQRKLQLHSLLGSESLLFCFARHDSHVKKGSKRIDCPEGQSRCKILQLQISVPLHRAPPSSYTVFTTPDVHMSISISLVKIKYLSATSHGLYTAGLWPWISAPVLNHGAQYKVIQFPCLPISFRERSSWATGPNSQLKSTSLSSSLKFPG